MGEDKIDAQDVLNRLQNDMSSVRIKYIRDIDYKVEYKDHLFILQVDSLLHEDFVLKLSDFIRDISPKNVEITTSDTYVHTFIRFKDSRLTNTPPESDDILPLDPIIRDNTCCRCSRNTETTIPPIKIKRINDDVPKWSSDRHETEKIDLCTNCSPAHYTDMARAIDAIVVQNDKVVGVEYLEDSYMERDDPDRDHVILTDPMLEILERDIL